MIDRILSLAIRRPKVVFAAVAVLLIGLGSQLPRITIDTDPQNMLQPDQPARVFHNQMRERFDVPDVIVVGVVNERDQDGVFNPQSLSNIFALTEKIRRIDGVIERDLLSPSTVDNIRPDGPGTVRFEWLLKAPPKTREEARAVREAARRLPTLHNTLVSEDGRAIALYVPILDKTESHRISEEIEQAAAGLSGSDEFHITGLPVAEDTFGVEMFIQMAVSAPLAALVIFLVMWWFFRSIALIASPMLLAIITVTITMGLLVGLGFTVHIMSSMIPIFLMPIAVVDSVHILSEFADRYRPGDDPKEIVREVMRGLFKPMLYTSLTSAAGFASLAFTPIPPVRVFGVFVAFGILLAFVLTMTFIPAYVVSLSPKRLAKLPQPSSSSAEAHGLLARVLPWIGRRAVGRAKINAVLAAVVLAVSIFGISKIEINDNPVRWFRPSHRIRVADRVLNKHFAGTYPAFLVLEQSGHAADKALARELATVLAAAKAKGADIGDRLRGLQDKAARSKDAESGLAQLIEAVEGEIDGAEGAASDAWEAVLARIERAQTARKFFQTPEALAYIYALQQELDGTAMVGKTSSLVDVIKTVHRELRDGAQAQYRVPDSSEGVAQTLLSYQSSHKPHFLWHFVTPDYRAANIWVQLKSGDNQSMVQVTEVLDSFLARNPPPPGVEVRWAGMTYLNVVWQQEMVSGMLNSLLGAFVVVFGMMVVLFRSLLFGALSMIPLSLTIAFIYGLIGLMGKAYDMPVAVLSSLTLGLSVDFAIHFLQRTRSVLEARGGDWDATMEEMFQEPGRAIARNAIVIAIGFLPLLTSPLVPYNTVGFFMAAIMAVSSVVTIVLLPGAMTLISKRLTRHARRRGEVATSTT